MCCPEGQRIADVAGDALPQGVLSLAVSQSLGSFSGTMGQRLAGVLNYSICQKHPEHSWTICSPRLGGIMSSL
jgi:hypothetical protein